MHTANCSVPLVKSGVTLMFTSTLEGSQLVFWCDESPNDTMIASCLSNGRWSVDLHDHSCTVFSKTCMHDCAIMVHAYMHYNNVIIIHINKKILF